MARLKILNIRNVRIRLHPSKKTLKHGGLLYIPLISHCTSIIPASLTWLVYISIHLQEERSSAEQRSGHRGSRSNTVPVVCFACRNGEGSKELEPVFGSSGGCTCIYIYIYMYYIISCIYIYICII